MPMTLLNIPGLSTVPPFRFQFVGESQFKNADACITAQAPIPES